uniref:Uncharacterized protein n=1 Tax=Hemiselmis tepida TaxID=464990 RepID=A0A7S0VUB2_9CRYP
MLDGRRRQEERAWRDMASQLETARAERDEAMVCLLEAKNKLEELMYAALDSDKKKVQSAGESAQEWWDDNSESASAADLQAKVAELEALMAKM